MKRFPLRAAAAALALALLSGCGQSVPASPVSLTVWTYYNGDQLTAFNGLVDLFNQTVGTEQGIYVESSSYGSVEDLQDSVLSAAAQEPGARNMPNIFAAYADTAYALDQMGQVVDLQNYLTQEELDQYVDSYLTEGSFSGGGSIQIFPTAKSTELLLLNATDWAPFAQATGATLEQLSTMEGLVETAEAYYNWTDSATPAPNDGKAFFGWDAMANYMLVGAMQMGTEIFSVSQGHMTLHFPKETARRLWENFYVPFVKGYFEASGRFRSDGVKTGAIISFVGSSSGATFFPTQVIVNDTESYPIEMQVLPVPRFQGGEAVAVQQGAGMVVTKGSEEEIRASVEFLKWFTSPEHNITFSVESGYLPVTKAGSQMDAILASGVEINGVMEQILTVAVDTVNQQRLYTPKAFPGGTDARAILEHTLRDRATADREVVLEGLAQGQGLEEAAAPFVSDASFEAWYQTLLAQLQPFAG